MRVWMAVVDLTAAVVGVLELAWALAVGGCLVSLGIRQPQRNMSPPPRWGQAVSPDA